MNCKVAKRLRRQAGVTSEYNKGMIKKDTKQVKVSGWSYSTELNQVNWGHYKQLKHQCKQAT